MPRLWAGESLRPELGHDVVVVAAAVGVAAGGGSGSVYAAVADDVVDDDDAAAASVGCSDTPWLLHAQSNVARYNLEYSVRKHSFSDREQ